MIVKHTTTEWSVLLCRQVDWWTIFGFTVWYRCGPWRSPMEVS